MPTTLQSLQVYTYYSIRSKNNILLCITFIYRAFDRIVVTLIEYIPYLYINFFLGDLIMLSNLMTNSNKIVFIVLLYL